jgi:succinyl-CoA synthetase beta subunit
VAVVLEADAKRLLADVRAVVPRGSVATDSDGAAAIARQFGGRVVIKALIPTGRKGKAGGVLFADGPGEVVEQVEALLGSVINGFVVAAVYVEEALTVANEYYFALAPSGRYQAYELLFSTTGGVDIEDHSQSVAPKSLRIDPVEPVEDYQIRKWLVGEGLITGAELKAVVPAIADLVNRAIELDVQLLEVNPLAVLEDGRVGVLGAMLSIDESAFYRQPEMASIAISGADTLGRPQTDLEQIASALNEEIPEGDMRLVEFIDGDVGFMTLGGGCSLVALDTLVTLGEKPATAFDMTSGNIEDKFYRMSAAVMAVPRLRGLFVGGNISAMTPVPIRVRGLARALRESERDLRTFPVVVRLAGPDDEEGRDLLAAFPEVDFYTDDVTIEEAVERFVDRLREVQE